MKIKSFTQPDVTISHFSHSTNQAINTDVLLIDHAVNALMSALGSDWKYRTNPEQLNSMREVLLQIIKEAYLQGSNDCHNSLNRYL